MMGVSKNMGISTKTMLRQRAMTTDINNYVQIVVPCNCIEADGLVTIIDEVGLVVRTLFVDNKAIDLQGLSSGFYFVKSGNAVKKVLVRERS